MQVMDHGTIDNVTLMSRIVQLEHERDELRRNAEQGFTLQNGIFSGLDLVSRIHGRRSNELEQELEASEKKLLACQKENARLQEELSEVYSIKSKFAEQLKSQIEKSTGLEKEVKYFQHTIAAALSERDRSLIEIERLQRKRDGLIEKVTDLQDRLDHVTSEYVEEKGLCEALYSKLEKLKEENDLFKRVTEKFWKVQEQATKSFGVEDIQGQAAALLQEPEGLWRYGEPDLASQHEAKQVQVEEELAICRASLANLQIEFEKEFSARKQAEKYFLCYKKNLFSLTELVGKELQQLSLLKRSLKEEVFSFFSEERSWILSLQDFLHLVSNVEQKQTKEGASFNHVNGVGPCMMQVDQEEISASDTRSMHSSRASSEDSASGKNILGMEGQMLELNRREGVGVACTNEEFAESSGALEPVQAALDKPCPVGSLESKESVVEDHVLPLTDDSKALAQALQEKVAALLLLSQQEERHILESNTTFALESQIFSLKQQLVQVTGEKMDALVKLASAQEKCVKLQEQEKIFKTLLHQDRLQANGSFRFTTESTSSVNGNDNNTSTSSRRALMQSYLRQLWSRGQELGVPMSLSHMLSLRRSKEDDSDNDSRLHRQMSKQRSSRSLQ